MSLNEVANFVSLRPIYVFRQSLVVSERSLFPMSAFSIFYCSVKIFFYFFNFSFTPKAQHTRKKNPDSALPFHQINYLSIQINFSLINSRKKKDTPAEAQAIHLASADTLIHLHVPVSVR